MTDLPLYTLPGFDQPIAILKHCHDEIQQQIASMKKLASHLVQHGATFEAQQTARALLKYFDRVAPLHHEDEEQNLMPMLQAVAEGDDAVLLRTMVPEIQADHREIDLAWNALKLQLDDIGNGIFTELSSDKVAHFAEAYQAHMTKEEMQLVPMARRIFSAAQMTQLGEAMQRRRSSIDNTATVSSGGGGAALADLRKDYLHASLTESDLLADPVAQFSKWFEEALKAEVNEPNAMSVATVGADGKPSSRILLIKQFDARGFTWYTNYESEKGRQLDENPHAALLFFWRELERQVRIEGRVIKTMDAENDQYFYSRPLGSQLSAIASAQSAPIDSRAALEAKYAAVLASQGEQPQRPPQWGGYRLLPERIEFWQGRPSRFHDRIVFTLQADGTWLRQRLQP